MWENIMCGMKWSITDIMIHEGDAFAGTNDVRQYSDLTK